jgi:hypothetical protein
MWRRGSSIGGTEIGGRLPMKSLGREVSSGRGRRALFAMGVRRRRNGWPSHPQTDRVRRHHAIMCRICRRCPNLLSKSHRLTLGLSEEILLVQGLRLSRSQWCLQSSILGLFQGLLWAQFRAYVRGSEVGCCITARCPSVSLDINERWLLAHCHTWSGYRCVQSIRHDPS